MSNASNFLPENGFDYSNNIIRYKGIEYPFRTIYFDREYSFVIVSVSSLNDAIFYQEGCWPCSLAEYIDSKIIFYVADADIEKSDKKLRQILKNNLS